MNDVVKVFAFEDFVAEHAGREATLEAAGQKPMMMKVRLRPYYPEASDTGSVIFSVERDDKVVALSECLRRPSAGRYELCYVSVDPEYRDQRLASSIVEAIADHMKLHQCDTLVSSYYTDSGKAYLKNVLRRLVKQDITLYEGNKVYRGHPPRAKPP